MRGDGPTEIESAGAVAAAAAGIDPQRVRQISAGLEYLPSPGGASQRVRARLVEIADPHPHELWARHGSSPFSSAGRVESVDARQLLRAFQAGAMFDSRLEIALGLIT